MKFDTIIWCSDLNSNTGEGVLAKKFLQKYLLYKKDKKIKIVTYEKKFFFKNKIIQKNVITFFINILVLYLALFIYCLIIKKKN